MKELVIEAKTENLHAVLAFVDEALENVHCSKDVQMPLELAVEEIFVNIASYAYHPETGSATIRVELMAEPLSVKLTFIDHGVPYDPLSKEDPDMTQSIEKRPIGGLGIFLVKKNVDDVHYEYRNRQNILTIRKKL